MNVEGIPREMRTCTKVVSLHSFILTASVIVQVAVLRLLKQLTQVYSVMKIERLKQLIPFMNFGQVEAIIVDAVKNEYIQVKLLLSGMILLVDLGPFKSCWLCNALMPQVSALSESHGRHKHFKIPKAHI